MKSYGGKCPSCGQKLSTTEFSLDVQEKWSSNQRSIFNFKKLILNDQLFI
jgi:DNA repair exonuclease SbcCD ATPase subunit